MRGYRALEAQRSVIARLELCSGGRYFHKVGVRWLLELAVAEMCRGWGCTVRAVLVTRVCLDRSQQLVGGRVEYVRYGLRDSRAAFEPVRS